MKVFIGWDSREDIAYQVCKASLLKHSSVELTIIPIRLPDVREQGLYWRDRDPLSSTEFTFTRFLVPCLSSYRGVAVFMDCDFFWRGDIAGVLDYVDAQNAVTVVKHDYQPDETVKMDGAIQTQYPRKNWSSLMVFNCDNKYCKTLTPADVNTESGMYLHRFKWVPDEYIGELPIAYNYLEGWHTKRDCPNPVAVHFTRGGPWFDEYKTAEYADEWLELERNLP